MGRVFWDTLPSVDTPPEPSFGAGDAMRAWVPEVPFGAHGRPSSRRRSVAAFCADRRRAAGLCPCFTSWRPALEWTGRSKISPTILQRCPGGREDLVVVAGPIDVFASVGCRVLAEVSGLEVDPSVWWYVGEGQFPVEVVDSGWNPHQDSGGGGRHHGCRV
jgi:hypothetical protein